MRTSRRHGYWEGLYLLSECQRTFRIVVIPGHIKPDAINADIPWSIMFCKVYILTTHTNLIGDGSERRCCIRGPHQSLCIVDGFVSLTLLIS